MFEYLGHRISYSIKNAISSAEEATLSSIQFDLPGLTRNRSLTAFVKNPPELQELFYDRIDDPSNYNDDRIQCFVKDSLEVFQAINPTVTAILLRAKNSERVISMINNFAVHPTVLGPKNVLYSSDLYGVASLIIKNHLMNISEGEGRAPVVSFTNGESGDVSANWYEQSREDCIRIGSRLAMSIISQLGEGETEMNRVVYCKVEFKDIRNQPVDHDSYGEFKCDGEEKIRTSEIPFVGESVEAGTEDGRVVKKVKPKYLVNGGFDECKFSEGITTNSCSGPHGNKKRLLISLLAESSAPKRLPVGIYHIGSLKLIALPAEITSTLGHRIKAIVNHDPEKDSKPVIIGLANEYISYFTTPSEYSAQQYEGGFTVYGKASGVYLMEEAQRIDTYGSQTVRYIGTKKYRTGPTKLKKRKVLKSLKRDWEKIDLHELYQIEKSINWDGGKTVQWNVEFKPFDYRGNSYLKSLLPNVQVQEEVAGTWKEFVAIEKYGSRSLEVRQSDLESFNFLNYGIVRNNKFRWNTCWMPHKEFETDNKLRMSLYRGGELLEVSDEFILN